MISVVIPLYNKEQHIANTIRTVLGQSFQDFEIVIVNDGSTDGSCEEVQKVEDSRIRLIHQANAGVSAARNRGIEEAAGEYIAFLDADDEWKPDYLATQHALTKKYPQCSVFAVNYEFRNAQGKVTPTIIRKLPFTGEDGVLTNYFEVASCSHPPICSISIMVRKSAIQAIGGFPVGIRLGEDLITWAKLACREKIAYSTANMAVYYFLAQSERLTPHIQPDKNDYVGNEFDRLVQTYDVLYLREYAARWHKMQMVTFVQLQRRGDARREYSKIKSLISPTKKDVFWYIMSFMPIKMVRLFLKYKDKLH